MEYLGYNIVYAKLVMQIYYTYSHFLTRHYIFLVNTPNPTTINTHKVHTFNKKHTESLLPH